MPCEALTSAPSVTLDGIDGGMLVFQAIAYVGSPRLAGGVRSDLLFTLLDRFKQEGLALATPMMVMDARPPQPPV